MEEVKDISKQVVRWRVRTNIKRSITSPPERIRPSRSALVRSRGVRPRRGPCALPGITPSKPGKRLLDQRFLVPWQRVNEVLGVERAQIVDAFSDSDEPQRNRLPRARFRVRVSDGSKDPALGSAVELGHHETGHTQGVVERLDLGQGILA